LRRLALRLAVLFLAAPASAQEMPPLAEWIKMPEARQRPDYTYTRCAGLMLALAKFDGSSFLPEDLAHMKEAYADFGNAAVNFRAQRDGMAPKDFLDGVSNDIGDFVDAYGQRIRKSRDAGQKALDGDPSMAQDFQVCRATVDALRAS
jgi:hypothetical protein